MQIKFQGVTAHYQAGPIRSPLVLQDVHLLIKSGSFTAVVGHTGAGKSSLLRAMNGLLLPREGEIHIGDSTLSSGKNKQALKEIRKRVGMVFQFPETQLFAETVEKDICFGPLNYGLPLEEATEIAKTVILQVGLDEEILSKSPFSLSGGQKRRVAIAGILAMNPDVLVLDEPGAGLDPDGKKEILSMLASFHREKEMTIVLVTHDMDDVAHYAEQVVVMEKGKVAAHAEVRSFFSDRSNIEKWNLDLPEARRFQLKIEEASGRLLPRVCLTLEELAEALIEVGLT